MGKVLLGKPDPLMLEHLVEDSPTKQNKWEKRLDGNLGEEDRSDMATGSQT